jgi:hypothetical protein
MKKIIFLDFDGVLHPSHFTQGNEFSRLPLLTKVFLDSPCSIVISSSWRFHYSLSELKIKLGAELSDYVIGTTGDAHESAKARYEEITEWLTFRKAYDWRAIDDSKFEFPEKCKNLILCDGSTGIDYAQIHTLNKWLKN